MKITWATSFGALLAVGLAHTTSAEVVVYDNLPPTASALVGYTEPNGNNPIFGDQLTLAQAGTLARIGLTLFNASTGGNVGSITEGTTLLSIYDNTIPYSGGPITGSLLGTATLPWDFGSDPLPAGFYSWEFWDISDLGITVPQNILITQQFTLTSGDSARNGVVLLSGSPVGSSPANVYISSSSTPANLYTIGGNGQLGLFVAIPEPATMSIFGVGLCGLLAMRRRD